MTHGMIWPETDEICIMKFDEFWGRNGELANVFFFNLVGFEVLSAICGIFPFFV